MRSLARSWNALLVRFADVTGFAPSGKALAIVAATVAAILLCLWAATVLLPANSGLEALYRNHGFGPDWQCDQSTKETVCFRRP